MTDKHTVGADTGPERYSFGTSAAARELFQRRSAVADAGFLLPHLRPGMQLVDCGCGTGSLTVDLAGIVSPGAVVGFDRAEGAINQARTLATARCVGNVEFRIADVYACGLAEGTFDAAHISGVLAHLADPGLALKVVFALLQPGGVLGVREPQKNGDWFGGTGHEACEELNALIMADWRAAGGDPSLGRELPRLLHDAGFVPIESAAGYSPALSAPAVMSRFAVGRLQEPEFTARVVQAGWITEARVAQLSSEIQEWAAKPYAVAALAECVAVGRKP